MLEFGFGLGIGEVEERLQRRRDRVDERWIEGKSGGEEGLRRDGLRRPWEREREVEEVRLGSCGRVGLESLSLVDVELG